MRKTKTLLAFCLITALLFSPLSGMDDHGANVVVTNKDGILARGELIAVKWDALVVSVDGSSPLVNTSIAIEEIGNVEIIKKSKVLKGMLWGALIGGGIGVVGGLIYGDSAPGILLGTKEEKAMFAGKFFGVFGFLLGALAGASLGTGKTFHLKILTKEARDSALLQLSEYAAIKGVR